MGRPNTVDGPHAVSGPDEGGPDAVCRPAANVPGGVVGPPQVGPVRQVEVGPGGPVEVGPVRPVEVGLIRPSTGVRGVGPGTRSIAPVEEAPLLRLKGLHHLLFHHLFPSAPLPRS